MVQCPTTVQTGIPACARHPAISGSTFTMMVTSRRIVRVVGILQLLDDLPQVVTQRPARIWNVFARSLGEQGAHGRTALAWRWALTGACPSPITLSPPAGGPPGRDDLLTEADASAELGRPGTDPGGQVMHARFVLQWLAGELDALPLWNGGSEDQHVSDGAAYAHTRAEMEEVHDWALLAQLRYPWPAESAPDLASLGFGWAFGAAQLLAWTCGEAAEGPLSSTRVSGRPTLYQVSLDVRRAMTALIHAREDGQATGVGQLEAIMDTFLWLAGWNPLPPIDRHGHGAFEDCPERETPCSCGAAGRCLRGECAACRRVPCVHGVGLEGFPAVAVDARLGGRAARRSKPRVYRVQDLDHPLDQRGVCD
jgi:hypothetical protein